MQDVFQSNWTEMRASGASSDSAGHHAPAQPQAGAPGTQGASGAQLKQIVTIRLDVDTLAWFKAAGPGYQTRINQLLRDHMEAQQAQQRNAA